MLYEVITLDWKAGDNIVSIAQEFPSNRIVWESLKPRGVEVRLLDLSTTAHPETALTELCDENTRLLSTSSVQYATGRRMDLEQLGAFCQAHEIFFIVDAIQSLGRITSYNVCYTKLLRGLPTEPGRSAAG